MDSSSFNAPIFIADKRDHKEHDSEQIQNFVKAIVNEQIEKYQISAWLMATLLNGLSTRETSDLTTAMCHSGKTLEWKSLDPYFENAHIVDKHSTGGVGDKVSIVLAPLAAAMGMTVPMMSGQGLAQTGGTVDKLMSIDGFRMNLSQSEMVNNLKDCGFCMIRQTKDYCPADKTLYSLRDVTATVPSIPLITASILSKKKAEGIDSLILDLKCGKGAFMKNKEEASKLAQSLVRVGKQMGMNTEAIITDMSQPLGSMVGNFLEIEESIQILKETYPSDMHKHTSKPLKDLCIDLCAHMAVVSGLEKDLNEAKLLATKKLNSGEAYERFLKLAKMQGAKEGWEKSQKRSESKIEIKATQDAYLKEIDALKIGWLGVDIGIGRKKADDPVEKYLGFEFLVRSGDKVCAGDTLAYLYLNEASSDIESKFLEAFSWSDVPIAPVESLTV